MGNRTGIDVIQPKLEHYDSVCRVYEEAISGAFQAMGLGERVEDIRAEIEYKESLLRQYIDCQLEGWLMLIAVSDATVLGAISFGPCGGEIVALTDSSFPAEGELGGLYVLPAAQNKGVGSALITSMLSQLARMGIKQFALDSGYKEAQQRWIRKFGNPYLVAKDYWGEGYDHMVWLSKVADFN